MGGEPGFSDSISSNFLDDNEISKLVMEKIILPIQKSGTCESFCSKFK
jgi:hypothetical protein